MAARPSIPLLALAAALALPAVAAAHTGLRASAPASGDTVADTLGRVRLEFTQRLDAPGASLVLTCGGQPFAEGRLAEEPGSEGRAWVFQPPRLLPPGPCAAAWRAAALDGHVLRGTLAFIVAATLPPDTAVASSPSLDSAAAAAGEEVDGMEEAAWADPSSTLSVVVRWVGFMALLGMIGGAAFHLLVLRRAVKRSPALAPVAARAVDGAWHVALAAAALSALTLLARLWLQSAALYGPEYAFDGTSLDTLVTETVWGLGWGLQALATVAFVTGLMVARAKHGHGIGWMGAGLAALLLSAVPALSGHAAAVEGWTAAAILSDWLHVLGAGVWLGTLGTLMLAGIPAAAAAPEGERTGAFAGLVGAFSPVALAGAGLAGVTGVINSLFHLSAVPQLWQTGYGRALLLKLALLAVVAALGFWNWRYITPNLHAANGPARLRRNVVLELVSGAAVILATAVLVALPPP
jgi:copper transport protein